MKLSSKIAMTVAVAVTLYTTESVFASRVHRGTSSQGPHPGRLLDRLANDPSLQAFLALEPHQVVRLGAIRTEAREGIARLRVQVLARRLEMRALLEEAGTTRRLLEEKAESIAEARLAVEREALRAMLDARDVLTPEQREKLRKTVRDRVRDRTD